MKVIFLEREITKLEDELNRLRPADQQHRALRVLLSSKEVIIHIAV